MRSHRPLGVALAMLGAALAAAGCASSIEMPARPQRAAAPSIFDRPARQFVYVGMSVRDLKRLVGEPAQVAETSRGQLWYYDFGVVIVRGGRVGYKYPEPRRALAAGLRRPAPDAAVGSRRGETGD